MDIQNVISFLNSPTGAITAISAIVAIFSAIIATLAEHRAKKIEQRIRLAQMLAMYADIGYGYGAQTNWLPWDLNQTSLGYKEYMIWLTRFLSYNGRINKQIMEDYDFIVECFIKYPKDNNIKTIEVPTRMARVRNYARNRVKKLGEELNDA